MSKIEQFPKNGYWLVASGSALELGSYEVAEDCDLSLVQFRVYNKDANPYNFNIRMVLSSKRGGPVLAASDWFEFSNATTGQNTTHWLVDVAFDFPSYPLFAGESYFLRLELSGYTRSPRPNQNDRYLAMWCDWQQPIYGDESSAARVALGVLK